MRKLSNLHSWVRRVSSALALIPAPGRPDATSVEVLVVSSRCAACFWVFEGGKRAASKVVWPSPDDVDHLLKLTRCEFGRDLVSRAVYGDQE